MADVMDVTDETFQKEVVESSLPVLVDFGATWCGPCKALAPIVGALAKDFEGRLKVVAIDIDKARNVSMQYGVLSVPMVLLVQGGQVKETLHGPFTKPALTDKITRFLG
jgi:thioredoxin